MSTPQEAGTSPTTDKSSHDTNDTESESTPSEDSIHNVKKLLHNTKVEGGKSAWATTLETFGMHEGKKKDGDILYETEEEALPALKAMAEEQQWEFASTPFDDFDATVDDLLKAFVLWSKKDGEDEQFNVSKAFRRLESYVTWMDKNCKDLNIKGDSTMKEAMDAWKMKLTYDKEGRLVWWIDIGSMDTKQVKHEISHDDTLRGFVWLAHLVMFDSAAQKGLVFVEAIGKKGFIETMTMVPMDLGTKLDRLTIGTLPIKIEGIIMFNNPTWIRVLMTLMRPLMSKKMKKRTVVIPKKDDPQVVLEEKLGKEYIPVNMSELKGTLEEDLIAKKMASLG